MYDLEAIKLLFDRLTTASKDMSDELIDALADDSIKNYTTRRLQALINTMRLINYHISTIEWIIQSLNVTPVSQTRYFNFEDGDMHEVPKEHYAGTLDDESIENPS